VPAVDKKRADTTNCCLKVYRVFLKWCCEESEMNLYMLQEQDEEEENNQQDCVKSPDYWT